MKRVLVVLSVLVSAPAWAAPLAEGVTVEAVTQSNTQGETSTVFTFSFDSCAKFDNKAFELQIDEVPPVTGRTEVEKRVSILVKEELFDCPGPVTAYFYYLSTKDLKSGDRIVLVQPSRVIPSVAQPRGGNQPRPEPIE